MSANQSNIVNIQPTLGRTRTLSITSGKGGVGKSTLVSNLALKMGLSGQRVLILDGDIGMANVDVMFGIRPSFTIEQVLTGEKTLQEVMLKVAHNVTLIPGGSGIYSLQHIDPYQKRDLLDQMDSYARSFDFMLIDTASGIDDNVLYLNSAAQEIVLVVTPEPSSLTDAYALIKVLNGRYSENRFSVVINMAKNESDALQTYKRLSDVAQKFLCVSLDYKGFIPNDPDLRSATISQQLVVQSSPRSPASYAIHRLAEKLNGYAPLSTTKGGMQFFWQQLVGVA